MQIAPDLDTGPAQLGRGGVCEGCAAEPLALLQRREKQAAARHPVGRVWPFSRRRPARLAACGRLVGGEQPGGLQSSQQHEARDSAQRAQTRFVVKSWGAPPKNLGVWIGNGATRRLTIYAFDPSISQHVVILVKELASRITAVRT